jgi:hypothetical protein
MGFFRREQPRESAGLVPRDTPFDAGWFQEWWRGITASADVDPLDERGQEELVWFTAHCLDDTARQTFTQVGAPETYVDFSQKTATDRRPEFMVALLAGWNPEMIGVLEQRLATFRELMVQGGRDHGKFRFGMHGLE